MRIVGMARSWAGLQRRLRSSAEALAGKPVGATGVEGFTSRLAAAQARGDQAAVNGLLEEYVAFAKQIEEMVSPENRRAKGRPLELVSGAQSKQFMADLLPTLQTYLREYPRGHVFDVLDVGPGTGHGSNLLASMYATAEFGYRMRVTALDISDTYRDYFRAVCRYVRFVHEDLNDHDRVYDIVLASHVIEHVPDPIPFCRLMQARSRGRVFVIAPFNEPADRLTPGHINVLDEEFLEELDPLEVDRVPSAAWGPWEEPPYEMFIAQLAPLASES